MTELVPVGKSKKNQVSLLDIQDQLDARQEIAQTREGVSTRKARIEGAKRVFAVDPLKTLAEIEAQAQDLTDVFDASIDESSIPLSQDQINSLSEEFLRLERLKVQIAALETRYRSLLFAHLDRTGPKIPGRPPAQVPGKVEAHGPGPHYIFERRGGNREHPDLNLQTLRADLAPEIANQVYVTVHHPATEAWDEEVFDESRFSQLVDEGEIDLDIVAPHLTPGKWRTPSFYPTFIAGSTE